MTLIQWADEEKGHLMAIKVEKGKSLALISREGTAPEWVELPDMVWISGKDCRTYLVTS